MRVYQGISSSPGLVVGHVSRIERKYDTSGRRHRPPDQEIERLNAAVHKAQEELDAMADRAAEEDRGIFTFQSMMLEDDGFRDGVRAAIRTGLGAAEAVERVGQVYADQLKGMVDNPYFQLRSADVIDCCQRVIHILDDRPREKLVLDHPVIIAAETLMPSDLFSVPSGMILGIVTAEGSPQSHAAIIARTLNIPSVVQVGPDFLEHCDGRMLAMDADTGRCIVDPDSQTRQQIVARICERQRSDAQMYRLRDLPSNTLDSKPFTLLANCFGPEDIASAMQNGAQGVGLLRSGYMLMRGQMPEEQQQYLFYTTCLAAARGNPVTVRTFDLNADQAAETGYVHEQHSPLGLRGIRYSLRQPRQFETQLRALLRAGLNGPLRVMFPMVTNVEDWDAAMRAVERSRNALREQGIPFDERMQFGVMLGVPSACLMVEDFIAHGCDFLCIGTNDLTQYTHAADRNLTLMEPYYSPASKAMKKLITMVVDTANEHGIPVTICGLAVGNPVNAVQYLQMGLRCFSMNPQNLLSVKKALLETEAQLKSAHPGIEFRAATP
jgi:phosphoenolpyruvate-protein phosphotransferase